MHHRTNTPQRGLVVPQLEQLVGIIDYILLLVCSGQRLCLDDAPKSTIQGCQRLQLEDSLLLLVTVFES
jgi:hypothetical protein